MSKKMFQRREKGFSPSGNRITKKIFTFLYIFLSILYNKNIKKKKKTECKPHVYN